MTDFEQRAALINELEGFGLRHIDWSELSNDELRAARDRIREKRARGVGYRKRNTNQQQED